MRRRERRRRGERSPGAANRKAPRRLGIYRPRSGNGSWKEPDISANTLVPMVCARARGPAFRSSTRNPLRSTSPMTSSISGPSVRRTISRLPGSSTARISSSGKSLPHGVSGWPLRSAARREHSASGDHRHCDGGGAYASQCRPPSADHVPSISPVRTPAVRRHAVRPGRSSARGGPRVGPPLSARIGVAGTQPDSWRG